MESDCQHVDIYWSNTIPRHFQGRLLQNFAKIDSMGSHMENVGTIIQKLFWDRFHVIPCGWCMWEQQFKTFAKIDSMCSHVDNVGTIIQVMTWSRQETSHFLKTSYVGYVYVPHKYLPAQSERRHWAWDYEIIKSTTACAVKMTFNIITFGVVNLNGEFNLRV